MTPGGDEVLARLLEGNERFVRGEGSRHLLHPELAQGQAPGAVVVCCSDSRVPLEIVFDQGPGELFVVRVAGGSAADPVLIGSVEFGVAVLGATLLVVLGHEGCGAVAAAIERAGEGTVGPGHLAAVTEPLLPAVAAVPPAAGDRRADLVLEEHVRRQVATLSGCAPVLAPAVEAGRLLVVGARYSLGSGRVTLVTPRASP
jgi:carbonic anhydrase